MRDTATMEAMYSIDPLKWNAAYEDDAFGTVNTDSRKSWKFLSGCSARHR